MKTAVSFPTSDASTLAHTAVLYVFGGTDSSVRTHLSRYVAAHFGATFLNVTSIEAALHEICGFLVDPDSEGYQFSYRIAADNLTIGQNVVADAVNSSSLTRKEWRELGVMTGAKVMFVEIECSNPDSINGSICSENTYPDNPNLDASAPYDLDRGDLWKTHRLLIDTTDPNHSIADVSLALISALETADA